MARALAARPSVLLLDEPAAGLDRGQSRAFGREVRTIAERGVAVLLIDHDVRLVVDICDELVVLNFRRVIAQGTPEQVVKDKNVVAAYLGGKTRRSTSNERSRSQGDNLTVCYEEVPAIRDVFLRVDQGEVVGLLGPNGAGKTTLLLAIAGLMPAKEGHIEALGGTLGASRHGKPSPWHRIGA